jgi:hypothetical protein
MYCGTVSNKQINYSHKDIAVQDKIENIKNYIKNHLIFYHRMLPKLSNNEHKN